MDSAEPEIAESEMEINKTENEQPEMKITPIEHATFVMEWDGTTFYIDPTGGGEAFEDFPKADYVLVTDIHGDHMDPPTLKNVVVEKAELIAPAAVLEKLDGAITSSHELNNGKSIEIGGFTITAIPMYNLTEGRLKYHPKGRGNGYVIEKDGYRVYISGDTEDIPEMRDLKNIDVAFLCMNLPYTMDVSQAVDAVNEFQPKKVYPYHYRGTDGFQDVGAFKTKVENQDYGTQVELSHWYPDRE
ncbi:MAG: MBL fold metallo-hydrolase [Nonlabens sp.]